MKELELKDYLREKRELVDLTQAEVARRLGYKSSQFISNWERGISSPPMNKLAQLIELYRLPRAEIVEIIMSETQRSLELHLDIKQKKIKTS